VCRITTQWLLMYRHAHVVTENRELLFPPLNKQQRKEATKIRTYTKSQLSHFIKKCEHNMSTSTMAMITRVMTRFDTLAHSLAFIPPAPALAALCQLGVDCGLCHVLCVMCHVLCVMCNVLCVMCHVLCVVCHVLWEGCAV